MTPDWNWWALRYNTTSRSELPNSAGQIQNGGGFVLKNLIILSKKMFFLLINVEIERYNILGPMDRPTDRWTDSKTISIGRINK